MDNKIKEHILKIRDTGLTNMFDLSMVQRMAHDLELFELVVYLEDYREEYVKFILYGEE